MPLVAPVWGVGKTPWVLEFIKVAKLADRPLDTLHNALLPAPTEEGNWTNRSTCTQEAKKWLLSVSRSLDNDPLLEEHRSKLGRKSWTECRDKTSLGHHSTGKHSHEIYNGDLLAEPIRQLELILQRIRTGAFLPDASRSGMITEPSVEDPSNSFRREESNSESSEKFHRFVQWCSHLGLRSMCMTQYLRKKPGIHTFICTNIVGPT